MTIIGYYSSMKGNSAWRAMAAASISMLLTVLGRGSAKTAQRQAKRGTAGEVQTTGTHDA